VSKRYYADWLKGYIEYTQDSEAPDIFHFWTGVSVIAGALGRRVWIDMGYFQWTPNFYIFFVAPPGVVGKSTTADIGISMLREIDGVKFGPTIVTWQALIMALAEAQQLVPMDDGTFEPMACITVSASELGVFFNPQDREMVDLLVDLWDGKRGPMKKSTKTQGEDVVENPWMNIIGCTTPSWIAGNVPEYMIGGGFTSRSIFLYAEHKRQLVAYPGEVRSSKARWEQRQSLLHDLKMIAELKGQYRLSKEAFVWGTEWYKKHWLGGRPLHMASERYGGYIARKQTHIHKLAMVIAAAQSHTLTIEAQHLILAEQFITSIEPDMQKVFKQVGAFAEVRVIQEIIALVRVHKQITRQELYRKVFNLLKGHKEFEESINAAIHAGYIKQVQLGNGVFLVPTGDSDEQQVA